jgi:general secretion pathway protein I
MRDRGFTLLEIMISLAVIGGLLVTLLYSVQYHLGIAEKHEVLTVSTILAKNKLMELEENPSTATGEFPGPYSGYRFVTGVKESQYPGISEIFIVVTKDKEDVMLSELVQIKK